MAPTVRSTSSQRHKYELQMTVKGNGLILIRINQQDNEQYIVFSQVTQQVHVSSILVD